MHEKKQAAPAESICFGLNRALDEQSFQGFVQRFARPELLRTLAARMSDQEIIELVDRLTVLMGRHLTDDEYHRLFLTDDPM